MLWWGKVDLWIYFVKNWAESILWLITFLVLGNSIFLPPFDKGNLFACSRHSSFDCL